METPPKSTNKLDLEIEFVCAQLLLLNNSAQDLETHTTRALSTMASVGKGGKGKGGDGGGGGGVTSEQLAARDAEIATLRAQLAAKAHSLTFRAQLAAKDAEIAALRAQLAARTEGGNLGYVRVRPVLRASVRQFVLSCVRPVLRASCPACVLSCVRPVLRACVRAACVRACCVRAACVLRGSCVRPACVLCASCVRAGSS
jgi:hypothetical protein